MSANFKVNNTTAVVDGSQIKPLKQLGMDSNYVKKPSPKVGLECRNTNVPTSIEEYITYDYRDLKAVNTNFSVLYPPKVPAGAQISVLVEDIAVIDATAEKDRIDLPITCKISINYTKDQEITPTHLEWILSRAISALYANDGSSRFPELMRGGTMPERN